MKYISTLLLILLMVACKPNRLKVNVSDIETDNAIVHFEKIVFGTTTETVIDSLKTAWEKYPEFVDLYTQDILRIGDVKTDEFVPYFMQFYNDTVITKVAAKVLEVFADFEPFADEIDDGFKHLKYYFPEKNLPDIYTYVSGFNQSLVVADDFIGVSLDKYLGADCLFYDYLGIAKYKSAKMYPEKIVSDLFYAYSLTEFLNEETSGNLLSNMIYEGKLMYFIEAMCPDLPDSVIIGYSAKELKWCKAHEGSMWEYLAEHKLLYTIERLDLQKFIGDSPFTSDFSNESPGRTGVWLGWQIVRSYMNENPDVTLADLMKLQDSQGILGQSRYFPK